MADISGASFAVAVISISIGGTLMQLKNIFRNKSKEEGRQEGRRERDRRWTAWNERRLAAERRAQEFTEPPPSEDDGRDG